MNRNKSVGLYTSIISIIAALVGLVAYIANANTTYFKNSGINPLVICGLVLSIVLLVVYVVIGLKKTAIWLDLLPIISCIATVVALANFISARVNGIAAIMTFENNASNMADLSSAIVGIIATLLAVIIGIVSAFFDVSVEKTVAIEVEK